MTSFETGRLAFLQDVRARWRTRSWRRAPANLPRELDRRSAEKIGREILACVEDDGGEASTRARVAQLATTYVALAENGRLALLSMIATDLGTPEERAVEAARRIVDANTSGAR